jgi:serine/threonine-protein kinase
MIMQKPTAINGRYVTSRLLGGGGMAQVFLARDRVLERDVAVKVLREQYAEDGEFVERFRREALAVASLSHPNIVQVYDRGVSEDGRYFIAMEYVPGGTLMERIERDGPVAPRAAAAVAGQIAEALGAAHERGLIHRDVKPQNVLVTASGDVKVADFGIARAAAAVAISETSAVLGTARYMSPEQAMGREVGPPSDLYSLGVVFYEMLTGEVPFEADTPVAVSMKHVNETPSAPREIRGEIPEAVNAVVLRLLAKDPGARYASAAALVADLDRVAAGLAPADQTRTEAQTDPLRTAPGVPASGGRGPRRGLARLLIPLALLSLVGAAGWGLLAGPHVGDILGSLEGVTDRARAEAEEVNRAVLSPDVKVPDVEELDEAAARKRLDEAGLGAVVKNRKSEEEGAGQVLEQSVPVGRRSKRAPGFCSRSAPAPDPAASRARPRTPPRRIEQEPPNRPPAPAGPATRQTRMTMQIQAPAPTRLLPPPSPPRVPHPTSDREGKRLRLPQPSRRHPCHRPRQNRYPPNRPCPYRRCPRRLPLHRSLRRRLPRPRNLRPQSHLRRNRPRRNRPRPGRRSPGTLRRRLLPPVARPSRPHRKDRLRPRLKSSRSRVERISQAWTRHDAPSCGRRLRCRHG